MIVINVKHQSISALNLAYPGRYKYILNSYFIISRLVMLLWSRGVLLRNGSSEEILSHNTSGISYADSTPVSSDITTITRWVRFGLALSIGYSKSRTQQMSTNFRIGS